jgi:hypothetical protein
MNVLSVPEHLQLKNHKLRLMLYTLFALIVADGLLTQFLVKGGYGSETNPFLRTCVGQDMFLAFKVSGAFLVIVYLWFKHSGHPKLVFTVTLAALTFYTVIIFWNLLVFMMM